MYIGVDLGTTNSAAGVKRQGAPPRTFVGRGLQATMAQGVLPSVVGFRAGAYVVGQKALDDVAAEGNRAQTVFSVKRLMGRQWDDRDPETGRLAREIVGEHWAYRLVRGEEDSIRIDLGDSLLSPIDVSARILAHLRDGAESVSGEKVEGAVVTVPAYFNDRQRWATAEAGARAGLTVLKILDEPTAAAIAFGVSALDEAPRTVLVYDLGGGTFDVSIITVVGPRFVVEQIGGLNWLAGDDFDHRLLEDTLSGLQGQGGVRKVVDSGALFLLRQRLRKAKEDLSAAKTVDVRVGDIIEGAPATVPLTREHMENLVRPLVERTIEKTLETLRKAELAPRDVDTVLLVGGSTKMPLVRARVEEVFGRERVNTEVDPMLCVAHGAAIQAYWLSGGVECVFCAEVNEPGAHRCKRPGCGKPLPLAIPVTERPYGVAVITEGQRREFSTIVPKGTPYSPGVPSRETRLFPTDANGARILRVRIYAGEAEEGRDFHPDLESNTQISTIRMALPEGLPKGTPVSVTMEIEPSHGTLGRVEVECKGQKVTALTSWEGEVEEIGRQVEELAEQIHSAEAERGLTSRDAHEIMDRLCKALTELAAASALPPGRKRQSGLDGCRQQLGRVARDLGGKRTEAGEAAVASARRTLEWAYQTLGEWGWLPELRDLDKADEVAEAKQELEVAVKARRADDCTLAAAKLTAALLGVGQLAAVLHLEGLIGEVSQFDRAKGDHLRNLFQQVKSRLQTGDVAGATELMLRIHEKGGEALAKRSPATGLRRNSPFAELERQAGHGKE